MLLMGSLGEAAGRLRGSLVPAKEGKELKAQTPELLFLDSNPSSASSQLCDLGEATLPLCALVSSPIQ